MPSKKKKYNARFPPARIKKIMQSDEEVGKVAQAVPVIISRALELFVENLLKRAEVVTQGRNAKTLTPSHLKQCILSEQRFDFLKDLVAAIPDVQGDEDGGETPRSAMSNTPFMFPSVTLPQSQSQSGPSSSSSSSSTSTSVITPTPTILHMEPQPQRLPATAAAIASSSSGQIGQGPPLSYISHVPPQLPMPMSSGGSPQSVIVSHSSILNPPRVNSNPYIPSLGLGLPQAAHAQVLQHQPPRPLSHFEYLPTNLQFTATTTSTENNGFGDTGTGARVPHPLSLSIRSGSSTIITPGTGSLGSMNLTTTPSTNNSPGVIVYEKSSNSTSGSGFKDNSE